MLFSQSLVSIWSTTRLNLLKISQFLIFLYNYRCCTDLYRSSNAMSFLYNVTMRPARPHTIVVIRENDWRSDKSANIFWLLAVCGCSFYTITLIFEDFSKIDVFNEKKTEVLCILEVCNRHWTQSLFDDQTKSYQRKHLIELSVSCIYSLSRFSFNQWSEWIEYLGGEACMQGSTHSRLRVCADRVICNEDNDRTDTQCKTMKNEVQEKTDMLKVNRVGGKKSTE